VLGTPSICRLAAAPHSSAGEEIASPLRTPGTFVPGGQRTQTITGARLITETARRLSRSPTPCHHAVTNWPQFINRKISEIIEKEVAATVEDRAFDQMTAVVSIYG
jgi:hypothetical protein